MIELMDKLNEFVSCSDVQEGLVCHTRRDVTSSYALEMRGNFSWRISVTEKADRSEVSQRISAKDKTSIGKHLALRDINLKIKQGDFVCVVGEVGSGKSTLLQ
mmetsp:Transcript_8484/g.10432  ORF Transcript_8484/g.10432 Transcript_8484/m.10432 type:complete len:103 (-) Transcript_8484:3752-4060(-)